MTEIRTLLAGLTGGLLAGLLALGCPASSVAQTAESGVGPRPEPVLRLTFEYRDGQLELREVSELTMVLPLTVRERTSGAGAAPADYAVALRDAGGETLVQVGLDDPLTVVSETIDSDRPDRIERHEARLGAATLSVLVPAPSQAASVSVTRSAPGQETLPLARRSRETLGSFDLEDYRSREIR